MYPEQDQYREQEYSNEERQIPEEAQAQAPARPPPPASPRRTIHIPEDINLPPHIVGRFSPRTQRHFRRRYAYNVLRGDDVPLDAPPLDYPLSILWTERNPPIEEQPIEYQQQRQQAEHRPPTPIRAESEGGRSEQAAMASGPSITSSVSTLDTASSSASESINPKLIWLFFIHRHGDRNPLNMAPKDQYNDVSHWPEGFGSLNNNGRSRMYKLGSFIRRRYDLFLSDNVRETYSRSSDVDRCIESSNALLAGLYPPTSRFQWNSQLSWVPAAVHTVPAPEDYLLNEAGRTIVADVAEEIRLVQESEAVKRLYEESAADRALLERELGYEYDMFYKFKCTYSTLDIEERKGLKMPDWYTPELKERLYRYAGKAFALAGGGTERLKKIRCGKLMEDIVKRMELASVEGPKMREKSDFQQPTNAPSDNDARKVVHYSTHDSIIAAFLEALNLNSPTPVPPGFGATFFIELYVDVNEAGQPVGEKYLKLFYMDDTESEKPVEKPILEVSLNERCQLTLEKFKSYVAHLLPEGTNV